MQNPDQPTENSQVNDDSWKPTHKQLMYCAANGITVSALLTRADAHRLIAEHVAKERLLPPTAKQETLLRNRGQWNPSFTRGEAWDLIDQISQQEGWNR